MTKSTITKEQLEEWVSQLDSDGGCDATDRQLEALIRQSLAAMDSEPNRNPVLAYADSYRDMAKQGVESVPIWSVITDLERNIAPLYRHAQPAPERDQVRREHAEWSQATFGNVGPIGPLKHLSKEALEAAAEPGDLSEWADMQFLLWDAQRRAGITDEQITLAMIEKLAVNKQREWPEPKDGEPRLHIKEQPAPVVPEKATVGEMPFLGTSEGAYVRGWNDCRAAMLQSRCSIQPAPALDFEPKTAEARGGNSPVIPDGYVMVPIDLLSDLRDWAHPEIEKYCEMWKGRRDSEFPALRKVIADADAMLAAAPQEVKP